MLANLQFPADLVIFTAEILNGKLHFFCAVLSILTETTTDIPLGRIQYSNLQANKGIILWILTSLVILTEDDVREWCLSLQFFSALILVLMQVIF